MAGRADHNPLGSANSQALSSYTGFLTNGNNFFDRWALWGVQMIRVIAGFSRADGRGRRLVLHAAMRPSQRYPPYPAIWGFFWGVSRKGFCKRRRRNGVASVFFRFFSVVFFFSFSVFFSPVSIFPFFVLFFSLFVFF